MPRTLQIETPNGLISLSPVPRARFRTHFLPLLAKLQERWLGEPPLRASMTPEEMLADSFCLGTLQSAIDLIPVYPENGLTVKLLQADPILFRRLFIGLGVDGVPELVELHTFTPIERPSPDTPMDEKKITIKDVPLTSCGDPDIDLFGDLMSGLESPDAAFTLMRLLDSESLDRLFFRLEQRDERSRDPDAVVQRYLKERYEAWSADNQDLIDRALYGEL